MKYSAGRHTGRLAHHDAGLGGAGVRCRDHAVLPRAAAITDARRQHVDGSAGHAGVVEPREPADPRAPPRHAAVARDDAARVDDPQERLDVDVAAVGATAQDVAGVVGRRERQRVEAHDAAGGDLVDHAWALVDEIRGHRSRLAGAREPSRGLVRDEAADPEGQREAERERTGERSGDEDVPELHAPLALRDGIEDDDASHEATDYRAIWYISRGPPGFRRRSCHVREASCRSCRWRCWRSSLPPAAPLSLLSRRPEVAM